MIGEHFRLGFAQLGERFRRAPTSGPAHHVGELWLERQHFLEPRANLFADSAEESFDAFEAEAFAFDPAAARNRLTA